MTALAHCKLGDELAAVLVEALPKSSLQGVGVEAPVAAAILRRLDATGEAAGLTMLRVANERRSLEILLDALAEQAHSLGCRSLVGPFEASPYLGQGVLSSHWRTPPLLTPYNPPYLPELAHGLMTHHRSLSLYRLEIDSHAATLDYRSCEQLQPARLEPRLLPLLRAACEHYADLPPLPAAEVRVIEALLSPYRWLGLVSRVEGQPIGVVLAITAVGRPLRPAGGLRGPAGWPLFRHRSRRHPAAGRVVLWGVLPEFRGRGFGRRLLAGLTCAAASRGLRELIFGPVPAGSPSAGLLQSLGAEAERSFELFRYEL